MSKSTGKIAQLFLEGLNSDSTKQTVSLLSVMIEELENISDPDVTEMRLVDNIYSFIEKMKILESNIRSYANEKQQKLPGRKLTELYNEMQYNTGSIISD